MGLLDGKVILITGGGRGIGRECAILSAAQGAKVVVNDLGGGIHGEGADKAPAQEVVDVIRAAGGEAVANFDSVADLTAVQKMAQQAIDTYGALHVVNNPAGFLRDRMVHNMSEEEWDDIISVHLRGHFNVVRATINHFRAQNEGNYIMWSSSSGLFGMIGQSNYGSAKMGIAGLSRIVAMEGERNKVRSNVISPGAATRLTDSVPNRSPEVMKAREAMRAIQGPERPAQLAVALSAPATAHISGQIYLARGYDISIMQHIRPIVTYTRDGGWTAESIIEDYLPAVEQHNTPLGRPAFQEGVPLPAKAKATI